MRKLDSAVLALAGIALLVSPAALAKADPLKKECVSFALKKPQIVKRGIKRAGSYLLRGDQMSFLTVRYRAMPEACRNIYNRQNAAVSQVLRHGKWARIDQKTGLSGGVSRAGPGTSSSIDNQVAFTGEYYGLAYSHLTPTRFDPCSVRILLEEHVSHPEPYPDSGYHKRHSMAHRVYKIKVPVAHIWPHEGTACNLLVP